MLHCYSIHTYRFFGMVLQVPMARHIIKVRGFLIIQGPNHGVFFRHVGVIVIIGVGVTWHDSQFHASLDRVGAVGIFAHHVIVTVLDFGDLALIDIQSKNLIPNGGLGRIHILNAQHRTGFIRTVRNDLLHDGLSLLQMCLIFAAQGEIIEWTRVVRFQETLMRMCTVAIMLTAVHAFT